mmetsp:Transcript_2518/g.4424  ORF Transcript_2518/g.4424 Transcript_2518/m.4424 type:complete len:217 (+) Transcript_2518:2094-2744(+)
MALAAIVNPKCFSFFDASSMTNCVPRAASFIITTTVSPCSRILLPNALDSSAREGCVNATAFRNGHPAVRHKPLSTFGVVISPVIRSILKCWCATLLPLPLPLPLPEEDDGCAVSRQGDSSSSAPGSRTSPTKLIHCPEALSYNWPALLGCTFSLSARVSVQSTTRSIWRSFICPRATHKLTLPEKLTSMVKAGVASCKAEEELLNHQVCRTDFSQ